MAIISALQGQITAKDAQIEALQEWLAAEKERATKAEQRAGKAEERAEKTEQRLIDELARLAAQKLPPATDFALPAAALEAIRADLEAEDFPELVEPAAAAKPGPPDPKRLLNEIAAMRSEMDRAREEGRGSDDQAVASEATTPETRAETTTVSGLPAMTAVVSAPISDAKSNSAEPAPESRRIWWSRFVPRRRRRE